MNIFKKLFSKKKVSDDLYQENVMQERFNNYEFSPNDETVKLWDSISQDELTQPLYPQGQFDNDVAAPLQEQFDSDLTVRLQDQPDNDATDELKDFEFDDFGATVLLNSSDLSNSDETVLLNNNINVKNKSNEKHSSPSSVLLNNIFLINPSTGEKININKQIFTIGSGDDVDYSIDKSGISKNHASVFMMNANEFYIMDNNSTNGTQVDGVVIEPMKMVSIENGELITFGDELYQFYIEG